MPPESVSGLCIFPRAATISSIRAAIRPGSPSQRRREVAVRGRVEAEPLDRDLELVRAHRTGGVEALGGLRQRSRRVEDPVGAELLADLLHDHS